MGEKGSLDQTLEVGNGLAREDGDGYIVGSSCKDDDDTEKGISLVVDVYGPPESQKLACVNGSDLENPRSKISEYESSILGMMLNGTLGKEEKPASSVVHVEFSSGHLVWVKTSSNSWWPGLIFDPSDAEPAENSEFSNALLLKYFGTNRMVWCDPSNLKLFVENFDEISKTNTSKMFVSSVSKAVIELSRRLELEMACSCKSKQGKRVSEKDDDISCNHGVISKFQPELFLPFLRSLALDCFKPSFLEVTSVQSFLASFYRSKLHSQPTEGNLASVSAELGHESRERRRSKYLSPPYTDKSGSSIQESGSKSSSKRGGKKLNKKQGNVGQDSSVLTRDEAEVPSVEILSNVLKAAVTGHSVSSEQYFSGFRTWAFCDKSISDLQVMETDDGRVEVKKETEMINGEDDLKKGTEEEIPTISSFEMKNITEEEAPIITFKKMQNIIEEEAPIITFKKMKNITEAEAPIITFKKKISGKKKEISMENDIQEGSSNTKKPRKETDTSCPLPNISAIETEVGKEIEKPAINPALASGSSEMSIDHPTEAGKKSEEVISTTDEKSKKKRKWKNPRIIPGFVKANIVTGLPDLNGNVNESESSNSNSNLQDQPQVNVSNPDSAIKTFKKRDYSSLKNFLAMCRDQNDVEIVENMEQIESMPENKKLKMKASEENPNASLDPNQTKKKQKKKPYITISDMNLTYKKLEAEGESIGSALILKFDPELPPLPSKEVLLAAFSKFGNLKESETDVFVESHTAQVVFLKGSEAIDAFCSLENKGPFGKALITFRLMHLSDPPPKVEYTRAMPSFPLPPAPLAIPVVTSEVFMRKPQQQQQQNEMLKNQLEMMTKVLEERGGSISPELRIRLEKDIKNLLTRLRSKDGRT